MESAGRIQNPRSLISRLPSTPVEDLQKPGVILKSKVRQLCRSLSGTCANGDSVGELEELFWNNILNPGHSTGTQESVDAEMLTVDGLLRFGEAFAERLTTSVSNVLGYENGKDFLVFFSLLRNWDAGGDSSGKRPRTTFVDACNYEKAFWNIQKDRLDGDFAVSPRGIYEQRSEIFENLRGIKPEYESPSIPVRAEPTAPVRKASAENSIKRFIGDCLFTPEVNRFHIAACQEQFSETVWLFTVGQFTSEIGKCFKGLPSSVFERNADDGMFRAIQGFCVEGLSKSAVEGVCSDAAYGGSVVWKVRSFLQSADERQLRDVGSTYLQFCSAVRTYLAAWSSNVDYNLAEVRGDLLRTCDILRRFSRPLDCLLQICSEAGSLVDSHGLPNCSYALLQYLYDCAEDCLESEHLFPLVVFLLDETAKPFANFVSNLALYGRHDRSMEEFGILLDDQRGKKSPERLWQNELFSTEIIPTFLSKFLLDAATSGRCLHLIGAIDRLHPILPKEGAAPMFCISAAEDVTSYREVIENYATGVRQRILDKTGYFRPDRAASECSIKMDGLVSQISQQNGDSSAFQNNLQRCLGSFRALLHNVILPVSSIQTELAQFALMDLFINQQNLLDHLRILHNYFFLSDGAFSLAFVSGVYQRAARFPLRPCLDIIAFLDIFESSLNVYEENQSVAWMALAKKTLAVTILSGSSSGQEKMPASYDIADYLCLQYEIPWPVGMLLTNAVMEQANGVFTRLLRIKGCMWVLQDAFSILSDARYADDNESHRQQLNIFRHNMAQVIRTLDEYFMESVTEEAWAALQSRLNNCPHFDQLRDVVRDYVNCVHARCFFPSSKKAAKCIAYLVQCVLRFVHQLRSEHSFAELSSTYQGFQTGVKLFLNALSKSTESPALLCSRLDFCGFYERMPLPWDKDSTSSKLLS